MEGVRCQNKGLKFGSVNFSDHVGDLVVSSDKHADVLNQEVQNLALKDSIKDNGIVQGVLMESEHMEHRRYGLMYPLRPEAEDCLFFMRHGWCRFRMNCRYNHPLNRKSQADCKEKAKLNEENLNRMAQVECKGEKEFPEYKGYVLGKYGSNTGWANALPFWPSAGPVNGFSPVEQNRQPEAVSAKASDHVLSSQQQLEHPKPHNQFHGRSGFRFHHTKTSVSPVNDKGLPLRPDTEVCAFYNRYGLCKHGAGCKFNHPVPGDEPVTAAKREEAQLQDLITEDIN